MADRAAGSAPAASKRHTARGATALTPLARRLQRAISRRRGAANPIQHRAGDAGRRRPASAGPAARGRKAIRARAQGGAGEFRRAASARSRQGASRPDGRSLSADVGGAEDQSATRPMPWINLANVLHALKRDAEALDRARQGAGAASGRCRRAAQSRQRAARAWRGRRKRSPASMPCWRAIRGTATRCSIAAPRWPRSAATGEALADFDAALALAPSHPGALYNRGNALCDLGRYAEALAAFDRALGLAPNHVTALNNRGRALQALNRNAEAIESFDRAIALAERLRRRAFQSRVVAAHASATCAAASPTTNGAGSAAVLPTRGAITAARCGSANIRSPARPFCSMPSRASATPSSSPATRHFSRAPAPR